MANEDEIDGTLSGWLSGFGDRRGGRFNHPVPRGGGTSYQFERECGDPRYMGVEFINGEDFDVFGVEVEVLEADEDPISGGPNARSMRVANRKLKKIYKRREKNYKDFSKDEARLLQEQRTLERQYGIDRRTMPWEQQQQSRVDTSASQAGGYANLNRRPDARPIFASASVAAAGNTTLKLTPQYNVRFERITVSGSINTAAVSVSNMKVGVDPLEANIEASSGVNGDIFSSDNTLGRLLDGWVITNQTPFSVTVTNNHTATQVISVFAQAILTG